MTKPLPSVFLGGTCDGVMWRTPFETQLTDMNVSFFNPMVPNWEPWMVEEENRCMRESPIVLFPVLSASLGLGSLAEIGFCILSVLRDIQAGKNRELIVLIDPEVDEDVTLKDKLTKERIPAGPNLVNESNRMRALVRSKVLAESWRQGVHLVDSLDEAQKVLERLVGARHLDILPIQSD